MCDEGPEKEDHLFPSNRGISKPDKVDDHQKNNEVPDIYERGSDLKDQCVGKIDRPRITLGENPIERCVCGTVQRFDQRAQG